jgi:hypothetical protein
LAQGDGLAAVGAGNDYGRFDDVSEAPEKTSAAQANVAVVLMMEARNAELDGAIEDVLGVLRAKPVFESAPGSVPFVGKIASFFDPGDQHVGEDRFRADQGFQIFLKAVLAFKGRERLTGDGFDGGGEILGVETCADEGEGDNFKRQVLVVYAI